MKAFLILFVSIYLTAGEYEKPVKIRREVINKPVLVEVSLDENKGSDAKPLVRAIELDSSLTKEEVQKLTNDEKEELVSKTFNKNNGDVEAKKTEVVRPDGESSYYSYTEPRYDLPSFSGWRSPVTIWLPPLTTTYYWPNSVFYYPVTTIIRRTYYYFSSYYSYRWSNGYQIGF